MYSKSRKIKKSKFCQLSIILLMIVLVFINTTFTAFADSNTYNSTYGYPYSYQSGYQNGYQNGYQSGYQNGYQNGASYQEYDPTSIYYYISGYDRICQEFYDGEAMMTRLPVISGNNFYLCYIANGLIKPAYQSIEKWCDSNLAVSNLQAYYLNSATIESQTENTIILLINCAYKRKGILNGYTEFRCTLDLTNNKYKWVRVGYEKQNKYTYEDKDWYYYP